jgi:chaperone protein EcpD
MGYLRRDASWRLSGLLLLLAGMQATAVRADVLISGTRFVYPAEQAEIGVTLANRGKLPVLVKAWIDEGDPAVAAERLKPPLLMTPPLARVENGREQLFRIRYTGRADTLPQDRESLFWINLLDVPPHPASVRDEQPRLQLAFQYRLKLFYRPGALPGDPAAAARGLRWSIAASAHHVVAENDAPYHVSLGRLALWSGGHAIELAPATILPHSRTPFDLPSDALLPRSDASIRYAWIDDWGGITTEEKRLVRTH